MTGLLDTLSGRKMARLYCLDHKAYSMRLQFNPEEGSLRLGRSVSWSFNDDKHPYDPWGGRPIWGGSSADTLSFSTLLDETSGGMAVWAAAAAKSALAAGLLVAVDQSTTLVSQNRLFAMSAFDVAEQASTLLTTKIGADNSILDNLKKLYRLSTPMDVGSDSPVRPPILRFEWGDFAFNGIMDSFNADLMVFNESGVPKRAKVTIGLKGHAFSADESKDDFLDAKYDPPSSPSFGDEAKWLVENLLP